jgi:putative endonuclease
LNGIQEVVGSIPIGSTSLRPPSGGYGWQASLRAGTVSREKKGRRLPDVARRAKVGWCDTHHWRKGHTPRQVAMTYVYLLESVSFPGQWYVGHTDDLRSRLAAHNAGQSPHTAKYKPWRLVTYVAFSDEAKAIAFERYLKSPSGRAFAKKRLR